MVFESMQFEPVANGWEEMNREDIISNNPHQSFFMCICGVTVHQLKDRKHCLIINLLNSDQPRLPQQLR